MLPVQAYIMLSYVMLDLWPETFLWFYTVYIIIVEKVLDVDDTTKAEASTADTSAHLTIFPSKLKVLVKSENGWLYYSAIDTTPYSIVWYSIYDATCILKLC